MGRTIKFTTKIPGGDRRHYINEDDIMVVLNRLPKEIWSRLREVHFNDIGYGNPRRQHAGYAGRDKTSIAICSLPPRFSFSCYCGREISPLQFGAKRGCQWSEIAIRRFLLYDVFLHELGHHQIIDPKAKSVRRKYAGETKAQEFANKWRKRLWSQYFDHPDPVHNPPSKEELASLDDEPASKAIQETT